MTTARLDEPAWRLRDRVARGECSAVEIAREALQRIEARDPDLGAFLWMDAEGALASAAQVDRARASGQPLGPLAGVPVAIKDNLCVRGTPTTCASKILEGWVAPYDAHVVERLRAAGAVIVGKTNLDEFAMGSSTERSAFRVTRHPLDRERSPGGSSGGSAVAVAAGMVPLALGSDTGGSVRQPAAFTGIVAIKPTYGRVSRYGLVAFASSLDQVGPMASDVRGAALGLDVIAGHDGRDATCSDRPVPEHMAAADQPARGLRVGVCRDGLEGCEPGVVRALELATQALRDAGVSTHDVALPHARLGVSVYYLIATAEASSNLARFDGVRYGLRIERGDALETTAATRATGFGPEVRRRIVLGTFVLSAGYYDAYYLKAARVRTLIIRDYEAVFARCDALLGPTSPTAAFRLGERLEDPLSMYLADVFTLPPSLAGLPAMHVPFGRDERGLPVGVQLVGRPFEEPTLVRLASALESRAPR
ncbi:MAG: Asp-tRNA(Asn)/Glu-tRNA(Gln) amidotransferase subunit GatA [Myxococcota bacterium]|nr:Asp-tRNA(Asn)/Glu-tRNA(Gln) amidotransferase subunit GatA [Myxococcota bacterium]